MLFGIVSNRGISAGGNDTSSSAAFQYGPGNAKRGRCGHKGIAESLFGSGLQRFPFVSGRKSQHAPAAQIARCRGRENAVLEIQRTLPLRIEGMHGDETQIPFIALVANEHGSDGMIDRPWRMNPGREGPARNAYAGIEAVNGWRRVEPASAAGVK